MSIKAKISIAEPSVIIRGGIMSILKKAGGIHSEVFEITEIDQLKNSLSWQKPDMLMINPSFLGLYSVQQLKKDSGNPDMKLVALQFSMTDNSVLKSYDEVISTYDSAEQIREKIIKLVSEPESETDKRHESLSQREKEVVVCVIQGLTNKQIADKLCLSTHTVITHRRNISAKLDIHSTAGLTIYAIVNKLVELEDIKGGMEE